MSALSKWKDQAAEERRKRNALARRVREGKVPGAFKAGSIGAAAAFGTGYAIGKTGATSVMNVPTEVAVGLVGLGAGWAMGSCAAIDAAFGPLHGYAFNYGKSMGQGS